MTLLTDATVLITGGTGSFGQAFVKAASAHKPARIIVYSRDEMKQWEMAKKHPQVKYFIGDVRDRERLHLAMRGVDYVIHAAAMKIVPSAEYNPFECIKTNVIGAMNVADAATACGVKKVVALSTDKASSPVNLYGASKLCSDKLFIASNSYSNTIFSVVRYGNVMGSRGSVIPLFKSFVGTKIPITDIRMTRFMITLEQGVDLVMHALNDSIGGEIYVRKIPSMKVVEIARTIRPEASFDIIGTRPGEKLHEQMIGHEDAPYTYEYQDYFKILPAIYNWHLDPTRIKDGVAVSPSFSYTSDNNAHWMTSEQLKLWLTHETL
jgi:UDP-N-acetylglucosamine 4,6-dehydratase